MAKKLVVTHQFGDRQIGDEITDPAEVAATLETHRHAVVPVDIEPQEAAQSPQKADTAGSASSAASSAPKP